MCTSLRRHTEGQGDKGRGPGKTFTIPASLHSDIIPLRIQPASVEPRVQSPVLGTGDMEAQHAQL